MGQMARARIEALESELSESVAKLGQVRAELETLQGRLASVSTSAHEWEAQATRLAGNVDELRDVAEVSS